ncbi:MAG: flagellar basal-body MS-ring/collar protein FliF [Thermodesulfobacteriota bacterium]|nr:flagellar basal-body MS-ring/collar protein FliF [Thermodesulfobacteriota bacterium]
MAEIEKGNLLTLLQGWPLSRKISLAAVALFSLTLFALIIMQTRQSDYQLLFANLTQDDASSVVVWLKEHKVPYEIHGGGGSVYVPADKVYKTRLELAGSGLPQGGGVGFEIFDKQSLGITDFVQKVNYLRAMQGELARTIASLTPIAAARVHLALPKKRLFKSQQQAVKASVVVKMLAGNKLREQQIQGIINLVAGSVERLEPEYVTVVNSTGKVLSKRPEEGLSGPMTPGMLEYQQAVERQMENRAQDMLDRALGVANSLVKVTAVLDFAQFEKVEELYDPKSAVPRSEQLQEQKETGGGGVGGVPGVQSNLDGGGSFSGGSAASSSNNAETTNYEISKVVNRTVAPVGTIKHMSVSVLVADVPASATDGKEDNSGADDGAGKGKSSLVPRSEQELRTIEKMVQSALGLDMSRGDQLNVVSMPFADEFYVEPEIVKPSITDNIYTYLPLVKYFAGALGVLLLYLLLVRPALKTLQSESTVQHFKTVKELEAEMSAGKSSPIQLDATEQMRQDILKAENSPAQVIRTWMSDED